MPAKINAFGHKKQQCAKYLLDNHVIFYKNMDQIFSAK